MITLFVKHKPARLWYTVIRCFQKEDETLKKRILFAICLAMLMFLSACQVHVDTDPWPASPDYVSPESTQTIQDAPQEQIVTPTQQPAEQPAEQEVKPGLNG
jgi:hypothetical protein